MGTSQRDIGIILSKWRNEDWTEEAELEAATHVSTAPIFTIGGCARSGTTLLRVMLDSHTEATCGPPSNLFVPTSVDFADLAFKFDISINELHATKQASGDRAEFIDRFRLLHLQRHGKRLWGDKTARNVHRFDWVMRHFTNARVVHVIRDGRDVACSLRTHRKRRVVDHALEPTGYVMPLEDACARWLRDVRAGLRHRGRDYYLEVRYEDLVLRTEQTLRVVCSHLRISYEPQMLAYHKFTGPLRDPLKFPQNMEATLPLYASAVGRWRNDLTGDELCNVLKMIDGQLEELSYRGDTLA